MGPNLRFTAMSARVRDHFGLSPDLFIGKTRQQAMALLGAPIERDPILELTDVIRNAGITVTLDVLPAQVVPPVKDFADASIKQNQADRRLSTAVLPEESHRIHTKYFWPITPARSAAA